MVSKKKDENTKKLKIIENIRENHKILSRNQRKVMEF